VVLAAAVIAGLGGLAWNARFHARQALAEGRLDDALVQIRRSTRLAGWNADGWLYRAQLVAGGGVADELPPAFSVERALVLTPVRPAVRMTRARARARSGDVAGAYADAARAAALYPASADYARSRDEIAKMLETASPR
jgi:hypothetical protein